MKKNIKFYTLIWALLLAVWCAVVFLVQPIIPGYVINYDAHFWISFTFIIAAFIGNLVCACLAFKAESLEKLFLNLSLITISRTALITMIVSGSGLMLIPNCPTWVAAVVCIIILVFNTVAVIKARWAADAVGKVDEKIKAQTSFVKKLTVDTENLMTRAKDDEVKAECKKVYEAIRYSDPMSNESLSVIEEKITVKVDEFTSAVEMDDIGKATIIAEEIVVLVTDRNKKCKVMK